MDSDPTIFADRLTGVFNRAYFLDRLSESLERVGSGVDAVSLLLVDLDDLFLVNETLGRPAGDQVLRELAAVLRRSARTDDVVARLEADRFALLLPGMGLAAAAQYAQALRGLVLRAPTGPRGSWPMEVCIGVASSSADFPQFAETLMELGLQRLDAAKRARRSAEGACPVWSGPVPDEDAEDHDG